MSDMVNPYRSRVSNWIIGNEFYDMAGAVTVTNLDNAGTDFGLAAGRRPKGLLHPVGNGSARSTGG